LSCLPTRLHTQPGGIGFLESILGLLKSLKIRALQTEGEGGYLSLQPLPLLCEHRFVSSLIKFAVFYCIVDLIVGYCAVVIVTVLMVVILTV
jgi:hypothetical protein